MYFYGNLFVEYKIYCIHGLDSIFIFSFLFEGGNAQTTANNAWN